MPRVPPPWMIDAVERARRERRQQEQPRATPELPPPPQPVSPVDDRPASAVVVVVVDGKAWGSPEDA